MESFEHFARRISMRGLCNVYAALFACQLGTDTLVISSSIDGTVIHVLYGLPDGGYTDAMHNMLLDEEEAEAFAHNQFAMPRSEHAIVEHMSWQQLATLSDEPENDYRFSRIEHRMDDTHKLKYLRWLARQLTNLC